MRFVPHRILQIVGCLLHNAAFQAASRVSPKSAVIRGYMGVASHVVGRYKDSVEYFQQAIALESTYFENRPQQKSIYRASEGGASVLIE